MSITVREYLPEDESEWLKVHAIIMSISHAWNYCIQERPDYTGYVSTRLVAVDGDRIIGLIDVQYENEPGELCFQKDSRGGYVLEFGRLPEYGGAGLGKQLMDAAAADARRLGFNRLEYWSQDRRAQRYYRRLGLKEISRHYRFRFKPPQAIQDELMKDCVGVEYLYGACVPEEWPLVREKYDVITKPPLEPHLCVGFDVRF
ncbi:MAG: GNAT family N-acetyltransferase [Candidatus Hydrogenedentes bacterium]|nr:GNAT family N-acetyltransferase [Candidatus Hydrogenedentota bacterium]